MGGLGLKLGLQRFQQGTLLNQIQEINQGVYLAPMPGGMAQHGFDTYNGKLYAFGGDGSIQAYEYNPATNSWITKTPIPTTAITRQSMGVRTVGTKIYLISGMPGSAPTYLPDVLEYDPSLDTYTAKAPIPTPREDFGTAVIGSKIYCFGGITNVAGVATPTNILEIYDTVSNTWDTSKASMPNTKILGDFGVECNGKIYAIGGNISMAGYPVLNPTPKMYEYDPDINLWTEKADTPLLSCYREAVSIGNYIYIMSGAGSGDFHNTANLNWGCYRYNTLTDTWIRLMDVPYSSLGSALTVYNGKIYMSGGSIDGYLQLPFSNYLFRFDNIGILHSYTTLLSISTIAENNLIGDVIGAFFTTDLDAGTTFTYTLVVGEGAADNASFSIDIANLKAAESFDYETKFNYSIRVGSMDSQGTYIEDIFAITITDVDETLHIKIGLASVWELDEVSGITAFDAYASNNGINNNAIVNQTGIINKAYSFNGTSSNVILGAVFNTVLISNAWSFSLWIKPVDITKGAYILANDNNSGVRQFSFGMGFSGAGAPSTLGKIYFERAGSPLVGDVGVALTIAWNHVVVTYDGTSLKTYVNGSLNSTTAMLALPSSANSVYLGQRQYSNYQTWFKGLIDQLAIWNKTLTIEEVVALANSGNGLAYTGW